MSDGHRVLRRPLRTAKHSTRPGKATTAQVAINCVIAGCIGVVLPKTPSKACRGSQSHPMGHLRSSVLGTRTLSKAKASRHIVKSLTGRPTWDTSAYVSSSSCEPVIADRRRIAVEMSLNQTTACREDAVAPHDALVVPASTKGVEPYVGPFGVSRRQQSKAAADTCRSRP